MSMLNETMLKKKLSTNLFLVNHYTSRLENVLECASFFCGLLYYRIEWLQEEVEAALDKPMQRRLLQEMRKRWNGGENEEGVKNFLLSVVDLLLGEMLDGEVLAEVRRQIGVRMDRMTGIPVPELSLLYDVMEDGALEGEDSEEEDVEAIRKEIDRLDSMA